MSPLIAYYRVSTQKQGRSGLGLEAQRKAVASFAEAEGFEIVAEFTEVETGKGSDALDRRRQLKAALKAAKKARCEVAVAKLDRLSRETKEALAAAKARGVRLGRQEIADANRDAAAARDAELEPVLRELSHLSSRAAAAEIERRGLGKLSYKTIARARVRLGLKD